MKNKLLLLIILLVIPLSVSAGIICNDGTRSATCSDCHRGCCSRHGGCTSNPNYGGNGYNSQSSGTYSGTLSDSSSTSSDVISNSYGYSYSNNNSSNSQENKNKPSGLYYIIAFLVLASMCSDTKKKKRRR